MTDEKVTDIREERAKRNPSNYIYQCPDCGCGQFWVYLDGILECVNCEVHLEIEGDEDGRA